jgi:hypothetical protein
MNVHRKMSYIGVWYFGYGVAAVLAAAAVVHARVLLIVFTLQVLAGVCARDGSFFVWPEMAAAW